MSELKISNIWMRRDSRDYQFTFQTFNVRDNYTYINNINTILSQLNELKQK